MKLATSIKPRRLSRIAKMIATVACVFSTHCANADELPKAEIAAVAKVTKAGGRVTRIAQNTDTNEISFAFSRLKITDESLADIHEVPRVVELRLQNTGITDDGLAQVAKLSDLTKLNLKDTGIGDAGIKHLTGLEKLEYLNLFGSNVTNECLESIKEMKGLKKVFFAGTKVDDSGLEAIRAALPDASVMGAAKMPVPPPNPLAEGKFVRVRLTGTERILSLAEVEVLGIDDSPLHKGGKASQSSLYESAKPELAIDGNTDGVFGNKSVTHTSTEAYPWWQVALPDSEKILRIVIWNRKEIGNRLDGAIVEILDKDRQVKWSSVVADAKDGSKHEYDAQSSGSQ